MHITFHEPKPLDLQELARVTEASLLILEPWYKDDHERSLALQFISTQARKYTLAIEDSVKAAQCGHDVAENALRLSDLVKKEDVPKEECDNFAKIMLKYASDAYHRSSESLEKFRNVRQDLSELISNAREADNHHHVQSDLDKLENEGIPVFEKLVKCVGDYIDWWNWIALGASAQKFSAQQLTFKYSKIRSESTIKKWRELKASFVQYTIEIAKVQDDHSKLFLRISEEQTPTSEREPPKYHDVAPHSQIARMRSDRKRCMGFRFWSPVSSFIRGVFCLQSATIF